MKYVCSHKLICDVPVCPGQTPHNLDAAWGKISINRPYKCGSRGSVEDNGVYPVVVGLNIDLPKDLFEL